MEYLTAEVDLSLDPPHLLISVLSSEALRWILWLSLTLCPSQIVQLCDGHGWSALFTLPPAFCSWSMWSQCWPWAHIHWDRRCTHGLITFLEQNSQIPSKSANLPPGHTLPRVADKSAFYCYMMSFCPCSRGFWLHVFTNLLTVHLLKLKHIALVVVGH